jgi:hypothetical protein
LNDFILLAQGSVTGVEDDDVRRDGSPQRRRGHVPFEYQDTSQCTLETAAASQCSPVENGLSLSKDVLLRRFRTGVRASVFSDDPPQLQSILNLHGLSHVPNTVRQSKIMILHHLW